MNSGHAIPSWQTGPRSRGTTNVSCVPSPATPATRAPANPPNSTVLDAVNPRRSTATTVPPGPLVGDIATMSVDDEDWSIPAPIGAGVPGAESDGTEADDDADTDEDAGAAGANIGAGMKAAGKAHKAPNAPSPPPSARDHIIGIEMNADRFIVNRTPSAEKYYFSHPHHLPTFLRFNASATIRSPEFLFFATASAIFFSLAL